MTFWTFVHNTNDGLINKASKLNTVFQIHFPFFTLLMQMWKIKTQCRSPGYALWPTEAHEAEQTVTSHRSYHKDLRWGRASSNIWRFHPNLRCSRTLRPHSWSTTAPLHYENTHRWQWLVFRGKTVLLIFTRQRLNSPVCPEGVDGLNVQSCIPVEGYNLLYVLYTSKSQLFLPLWSLEKVFIHIEPFHILTHVKKKFGSLILLSKLIICLQK